MSFRPSCLVSIYNFREKCIFHKFCLPRNMPQLRWDVSNALETCTQEPEPYLSCLLQSELNHPLDSGNNSVALEHRVINNGSGCPT